MMAGRRSSSRMRFETLLMITKLRRASSTFDKFCLGSQAGDLHDQRRQLQSLPRRCSFWT